MIPKRKYENLLKSVEKCHNDGAIEKTTQQGTGLISNQSAENSNVDDGVLEKNTQQGTGIIANDNGNSNKGEEGTASRGEHVNMTFNQFETLIKTNKRQSLKHRHRKKTMHGRKWLTFKL